MQNGRIGSKIAAITEAHERKNALSHQCRSQPDDILPKPFDGVPLRLFAQTLAKSQVVGSLIFRLRNQNGIGYRAGIDGCHGQNSAVGSDGRTALKMVMKIDIRIAVCKFRDDLVQRPTALVVKGQFVSVFVSERLLDRVQRLNNVGDSCF